jgi:hypothetical protein
MATVQKKRGEKNNAEYSSQEKVKAKPTRKTAVKKLIWYVSSNWME